MAGYERACCHCDGRCYCGREAPLHLPPEEQNCAGCPDCVRCSLASSSRSRSPLFGHEPQCYSRDNKCHCGSTQPYQLPPEGQWQESSQLFPKPAEPPLTVKMTAQQIVSCYSSSPAPLQFQRTHHFHGDSAISVLSCTDAQEPCHSLRSEFPREADGGNSTVPAGTEVPGEECPYREPPPSYQSLYPSLPQHGKQP